MNEKDIFGHLFEAAKDSKDPRGVVVACLVQNGQIVLVSPSSDDGVWHAEDLLFKRAKAEGLEFDSGTNLYATLEPCSKRSRPGMVDCVTEIIEAGIGAVVFGARDPGQSKETTRRLREAGISIVQSKDAEIVKRCAEIFNESVTAEHEGVDVELKPKD